MDYLINVNDLSFSYKNRSIFESLNFSVKKNTLQLIVGANNSGKTTLIRLLTGVLPSDNCITLDGVALNKNNIDDYILKLGVIFFENNKQFLCSCLLDELEFPLENLNCSKATIKKRVNEIAKLFGFTKLGNCKIADLTEFDRVKVLIAVAAIHNPKVIFLDDPFLYLNKKEQSEIFEIFKVLKKKMSVVITSSNIDNILSFDDVIVLDEMKILVQGAPEDVLRRDNELARAGVNISVMMDLSLKLQFYGLLDEVILDTEGLVDKLWN